MKRLRPQWVGSENQIDAELAAAEEAEAGLEELADLFAEPEGHDLPQPPPASTGTKQRRTKRPRRQIVSINFGSQDPQGQSQDADGNLPQEDSGIDLVTPPWLQPKTPKTATNSKHSDTADGLPDASYAAAAAVGTQQQKRTPQAQALPTPSPAAARPPPGGVAEPDVISSDSSDDFEPPSSSRRTAGRVGGTSTVKGQRRTPASAGAGPKAGAAGRTNMLERLLGSTPAGPGSSVGPSAAGRTSTINSGRQQTQQHQPHQQQHMAAGNFFGPPGCPGSIAAGVPGHQDAAETSDWVPPRYRNTTDMQDTAGLCHTAGQSNTSQQQGHEQQQQQQRAPSGSHRPPGLLERASVRPGAAGGGVYAAPTPPAAPAVAAAAGGGDGNHDDDDDGAPWWMVLPDFVPVEVLLLQQVNPRDGAPVFINYKSQFKDGGAAAAPRGRKAAAGGAAGSKQPKAKGRRGKAAAAAAAGAATGFMSAAEMEAGSSGRGSKGRKRRRSSKAAGGSSGRGRRKRQGSSGGGGGGGQWRTVGGKKVFISTSGTRLTGASAWKAYKGHSKGPQ